MASEDWEEEVAVVQAPVEVSHYSHSFPSEMIHQVTL